eukprot:scaffold11979_cov71-Phaeocystis_antarctica.AAC.2
MAPKFVCPEGELAGMDYEHVAPRLTLPHVDWARAARPGGHPGAARRVDGLEKPNLRNICGSTHRHVAYPSQAYSRYPTVQADASG